MGKVNVELCPETGICSILKSDGKKIDLMPDEVAAVRDAANKPGGIQQVLKEIDPDFAEALGTDEARQVAIELG